MLKKIFWVSFVITVLMWMGVGIYYLKSASPFPAPATPFPEATMISSPQPAKPVFESLEHTHFVVGQFQGWEKIEGFQDRYILLINPATKRNYPKIKVVLEPRNPYESNQFWEGMTAFAVEKTGEEYDDLGYVRNFTAEEIDKLIKKGDLIKVVFEKESIIKKFEENSEDLGVKDLEGKTDDFLALSLVIKRAEGKAAVEQELGRKIQ